MPNSIVKIRKWSITSGFTSATPHLYGNVYGHPNFEDGEVVVSSVVMSIDLERRIIKTYSGRTYHLEDPDPAWLQWLEDNGYEEDIKKLFPN